MIFRVAHDEQTGIFRLLELSGSGMRYRSPDERSWLGVWLIENEGGVGAVVRRVEDSSPAQEAGFEQGDILLTLADKSIASPSQVNFLLSRMKTRHRGFFRTRAQWCPNGEDGTVGNPTRTPPPQMRTGTMILVVDDDISVTTSLSLLLKQAGYQTATAASLAGVLYYE